MGSSDLGRLCTAPADLVDCPQLVSTLTIRKTRELVQMANRLLHFLFRCSGFSLLPWSMIMLQVRSYEFLWFLLLRLSWTRALDLFFGEASEFSHVIF